MAGRGECLVGELTGRDLGQKRGALMETITDRFRHRRSSPWLVVFESLRLFVATELV